VRVLGGGSIDVSVSLAVNSSTTTTRNKSFDRVEQGKHSTDIAKDQENIIKIAVVLKVAETP
jgi:hypothetical protein